MKPGILYIITKASNDGTFYVGDKFKLLLDGAILNCSVGGWIDPENIPKVMESVEFTVDQEWALKEKRKLLEKLKRIESVIHP